MTIWKETFRDTGTFDVQVPKGAEWLQVGFTGSPRELASLWFLCDPEAPKQKRTLVVVGTGWEVPDEPCEYVGTAVTSGGFVWHVFEAEPTP